MLKKILFLLVISSVFLVACQSTASDLPAEPTADSAVDPEGADTASTELPALPEVSPTPSTQDQGTANCTVVSQQPTPGPTEQSLVPPVSDDDWTQGPDDAAVTFVEYGDFQ